MNEIKHENLICEIGKLYKQVQQLTEENAKYKAVVDVCFDFVNSSLFEEYLHWEEYENINQHPLRVALQKLEQGGEE